MSLLVEKEQDLEAAEQLCESLVMASAREIICLFLHYCRVCPVAEVVLLPRWSYY